MIGHRLKSSLIDDYLPAGKRLRCFVYLGWLTSKIMQKLLSQFPLDFIGNNVP